jgi:hypothetical protein
VPSPLRIKTQPSSPQPSPYTDSTTLAPTNASISFHFHTLKHQNSAVMPKTVPQKCVKMANFINILIGPNITTLICRRWNLM